MMTKILFIGPANSIHTYRWMKYFDQPDYELFLLTDQTPAYSFSFAQVIVVPRKNFKRYFGFYIKRMSWLLKIIQPDICHVHYLAYLGWLPALLNAPRLVITPWGSDLLKSPSHLEKLMNRMSFSRASFVCGDSYELLDISENYGASETQLVTFGVDLSVFQPVTPEKKSRARQTFDLPQEATVILSNRAFLPFYNIDKIVSAFAELAHERPGVYLVLLDYNADPTYKAELMASIQVLGLKNRVRVQPALPHGRLAELYHASDLMVSVPSRDGTPASFFEAMACGLPILSLYHKGYEGIFEAGKNISYIPEVSASVLHKKMSALLGDPLALEQMAQEGYILAKGHSFEVEMQKVARVYARLMGE